MIDTKGESMGEVQVEMRELEGQKERYLGLFYETLSLEMKANILKWIEALESGKYLQGQGTLAKKTDRGTKYCCLGVANEVCELGNKGESPCLYKGKQQIGLRNDVGFLQEYSGRSLANLNDHEGWSFMEIANLLKDQLQHSVIDGEDK